MEPLLLPPSAYKYQKPKSKSLCTTGLFLLLMACITGLALFLCIVL